MDDLAQLAPAIDPRGYVYLCPNAPISMSIGPDTTGFAWTPLTQDKTSADVAAAEKALMSFLEEVSEEYGPLRAECFWAASPKGR